jgi:hypothetical protein
LRSTGPSIRREPRRSHLKSQRWLGALIIALAGCFCAKQAFGQNLQLDNQPKIIHGTVVNAVTHDPIGRAFVYSPDNRYATLRDSEGHFAFALPKVAADSGGTISSTGVETLTLLVARKPGFLDDYPNERRPVGASPGTELTISLVPEALIKGRVTVPAGDAARGITVEILFRQVQDGMPRWMPKNSAATNSNGEFRFAELQPGAYTLLAIENGWDLDWSQPGVIAVYLKRGRTIQVGNQNGRPVSIAEAIEVQSK